MKLRLGTALAALLCVTGPPGGRVLGAGAATAAAPAAALPAPGAPSVGAPSLGALSVSATPAAVTLSLSAGISGGSGGGYGYRVYRDTQPAVSTAGAPYATVSGAAFAYADSAVTPGQLYYYKVVGYDGSGATAGAVPAGLAGATGPLAVAAAVPSGALAVDYLGDSITYGTTLPVGGSVTSVDAPFWADHYLASLGGVWAVAGSNQGHSGHTWADFQPGRPDFMQAEAAMTALLSANPGAKPVFSIMLGTNDSATSGTDDASATPAHIAALAEAVIARLLSDFPASAVVLNDAPLYSPNTHNASTYGQAGVARLVSYAPALAAAVSRENGLHPGHAFVGDTTAPAFFAANYLTEQTAEEGREGTFYLHPNAQGAQDLGRLWANGIYRALHGAVTPARPGGASDRGGR